MYNQAVLEKYCPAPEMGIDIDAQGYIKVCCVTGNKVAHLEDEIDWANFFVSERWTSIREDIQTGNSKVCEGCARRERQGIISQRQQLRYNAGIHTNELNYSQPINIDIDLGNVCNLWCVMCNSTKSTKWHKIDKDGELHKFNNYPLIQPFKFKRKYIDNVLDKMFDKVQRCSFKGGEPFAYKDFEYTLEWLLKKNCRNAEMITNGTLWSEKYNDIFSKFPRVFFTVSVDGRYRVSDWIRYDKISSYQVVRNNIGQMSKLKNAGGSLVHVTMPYNLYSLPDFLLDFNDEFAESNWWINLKQICVSPVHLNVNDVIPLDSRLRVADRLKNLKLNYRTRYLEDLIKYIELPVEPNIEMQRRFVEYTNLIDKKKTFSIWDEVPELRHDLMQVLK